MSTKKKSSDTVSRDVTILFCSVVLLIFAFYTLSDGHEARLGQEQEVLFGDKWDAVQKPVSDWHRESMQPTVSERMSMYCPATPSGARGQTVVVLRLGLASHTSVTHLPGESSCRFFMNLAEEWGFSTS